MGVSKKIIDINTLRVSQDIGKQTSKNNQTTIQNAGHTRTLLINARIMEDARNRLWKQN